jgi:hypothetical protein
MESLCRGQRSQGKEVGVSIVEAYFESAEGALVARNTLGSTFACSQPVESGRSAHRPWVLRIRVPEHLSVGAEPDREARRVIDRAVFMADGEVDQDIPYQQQPTGPSRFVNRLPSSVIRRYEERFTPTLFE